MNVSQYFIIHFYFLTWRGSILKFCLSLFFLRATNPSFKEVLSRIESHEDCRNLPMISFLILPMQRVTRLPLLMDVRCDLVSLSSVASCAAASPIKKIILTPLKLYPFCKMPQLSEKVLFSWKVPPVSNIFGNYLQFRLVGSLWRS